MRNYDTKLSASILCRTKCVNYRDTGVSKIPYNSSTFKVTTKDVTNKGKLSSSLI